MLSGYRQRTWLWFLRSPYNGRDIVLITVVCLVLVITWSFDAWLRYRADLADRRADSQRAAICAILAGLPSNSPPYIIYARQRFAPPGHPRACDHVFPKPRVHHPKSKSTNTGVKQPGSTTIVIVPSVTDHPVTSPGKAPSPPHKPTTPPSPPRRSPPPPAPRLLPTVCVTESVVHTCL